MGAQEVNNGGKRLLPEERMTIPALYAATGSKEKVAKALGCDITTVTRWLNNLSGEEWERIQEEQRKVLLDKSIEILYQALDLAPQKLRAATIRDILGTVKIMRDAIAAWGGVGAAAHPGGAAQEGELDQLLAAGEAKRRQRAIEEAVRTGSLEGLKAFVVGADEVKT
jgi:hypothetical protein